MNDRRLDRRGLTELFQNALHQILQFFFRHAPSQPRLDLKQHRGRHAFQRFGRDLVFVDDMPFNLPNARVDLRVNQQVRQGLDAVPR